jgi:hypothetical protein
MALQPEQCDTSDDNRQGACTSSAASVIAAAVTAVIIVGGSRGTARVPLHWVAIRGRRGAAAAAAAAKAPSRVVVRRLACAILLAAVIVSNGSAAATSGNRRRGIVLVLVLVIVVVVVALVLLALFHVETGCQERTENGWGVAVNDGVVGSGAFLVFVADALVGARSTVGIPALDVHRLHGDVVVPGRLDVLVVPVDHTAGPVDGALGAVGQTTRPQRDLNTGRGLGVLELLGRLVEGVLAINGTADLTVDEPLDLVGRPVDLVVVEIVESV